MAKDPYSTLGLKKSATQDEIKAAYRDLAKKLHPDLNPGNKEAERKFKDVNAAYELLGDPKRRLEYDRSGETPSGGASPGGGSWQQRPFYSDTQGPQGGRYTETF